MLNAGISGCVTFCECWFKLFKSQVFAVITEIVLFIYLYIKKYIVSMGCWK